MTGAAERTGSSSRETASPLFRSAKLPAVAIDRIGTPSIRMVKAGVDALRDLCRHGIRPRIKVGTVSLERIGRTSGGSA
jgi:hypothetical protein